MTPNPKLKIEKRINEELEGLRKIAAALPTKQRHALINHCGKLAGYAKKAQAIADAHLYTPTHAGYDARTTDDLAAQAEAKKAVFEAMKAGRKVSLRDGREFHHSQMHTVICKIRQDIDRKDLPWEMCDEWVRPEGTRPFKQYWLIPKEEEGPVC